MTLIWSKLHIDQERKIQEKAEAKLWIIHYSLVYSINIHGLPRMCTIHTAVVSLSFEGFSHFNMSPTTTQ